MFAELKNNIPNSLTVLRVLLIPFFVLFLSLPGETFRFLAVSLFIVAALTDWLDGYLARKWNQISDFGKLMDPLADKILTMAALVMLGDSSFSPGVPDYLVVIILAREMAITGLRSFAVSKGKVVAAGELGKVKTVFMMVAIPFLILGNSYSFSGVGFGSFGLALLLIGLIFSLLSAWQYLVGLRGLWQEA